jgi:hypothetical protein
MSQLQKKMQMLWKQMQFGELAKSSKFSRLFKYMEYPVWVELVASKREFKQQKNRS